ncbi:MAG TPA: ribose 5-phosphate isomerase B [Paenibacillus sp.]|uniref:ribose 5-phosphate isomerase B n=1 Tax=Paenibacillus sp. TaxID=58172 RepID=UPI002CE961B8|nr:ribose 5-phosphate isomerase B [Paenibacillus sp.]HUC94187.1 ribose 5-phosphate isomerase B [Paenibacillus sp.]
MIIALGNDHAGFPLKGQVVDALNSLGVQIIDHGSYDEHPVDFPDIARLVCRSVLEGKADRGIMVCGTGVGASIAANKIPGIRASVCHDIYSARQCVEHDDVNVMCLGAQIIGGTVAKAYIEAFLEARFSTEEHFRRRVAKLAEMERSFYNPS